MKLIHHKIQQNSDEWLDLRAGKITGSALAPIMANFGKAFGEPAKKAAVNIAIERLTKKRIESTYSNSEMERGHIQEPLARELYELNEFITVDDGGFFELGNLGCSPDGLIGGDGIIEIKSVLPHVQASTIKRGNYQPAYKWQLFFALYVTRREWIDYASYCDQFVNTELSKKALFVKRVNNTDSEVTEAFEMIECRLEEFESLVSETIELLRG